MAATPPRMAAPHRVHERACDRALAARCHAHWLRMVANCWAPLHAWRSTVAAGLAQLHAPIVGRIARLRRGSRGSARPYAARYMAAAAAVRRVSRQCYDG
ncbi:hypothetical protein F511_45227 [Dorcoceras hygrometricum]|uniref:Uncharacterized protein n=1 Tax=Dorcoceras hygrometricum TaxID=472368 RepID=A0A2Z6ZX29_9LAMI|nr:hypothetical protein F511_45227 [Dorcoceras hygrometricum]